MFTPVSLPMSMPETLPFILLNVRSLKKHAIDIAYDKRLIEYDILFLTETEVSQIDDLSAMQSILDEHTPDHNISNFGFSSLAICYKSTIFVSCHHENDGTSFFQVFRQTYSGKVISVVLMYRKCTESVSLFYEKLETLNAREEVDIILGDLNLNSQDPQVFQDIPSVLSNFQFLSQNYTHLNGSHIDNVFVA